MNHDKLKRLRSKVMFTIVGGVVIINPIYAQNTQPPAQAAAAGQTSSQQSNNKQDDQQQSPTELGAIVVSGVRNSLEQSMNIKRNAIGIVDAISAEDLGKFPDTNLAASLQRITGVSIDRRNGAGAQVTVRGFGPQFNMVTVDGRTIPGADAFGAAGQVPIGNINGGTRAFNFAQLSPTGVSTLEVYKTGRANVASGGIGATINVKTDKPFYHPGGEVIASVGAKGIYDTSQPFDNSITPAFSGIFSYANKDKTWGIGLNVSYQKRHGGSVQATENAWDVAAWDGSDGAIRPGASIINEPAIGQLYALPKDLRYAYYDFETERQNAHAVLQLSPVDSLTLTLDYLASRYEIDADRGEQSMWLQRANSITAIKFDTDEAVATPVYLRDVPDGLKDFGLEQQAYAQKYKLDSIGFNATWDVSDSFQLAFDAHDSKSQSLPNDSVTGGGATFVGVAGTNNCTTGSQCGGAWGQEFWFNNGLPRGKRTWYSSHAAAIAGTGGLVNEPFGPQNLGVQPLRVDAQSQVTEIKEFKIDGQYFFDNGRFQFGADVSKTDLHRTQASQNYQALGDWSVTNAGQYPDLMDYLHEVNTVGLFDGYNTNGIANSAWIGNADALTKWAKKHYPGISTKVSPLLQADNRIKEDTKAVYMQVVLNGQLGSMPTTTRFGLRYERTDVTSTAMVAVPQGILWLSNNDFQLPLSTTMTPYAEESSYSELLPNIDFSINFTPSLKGRVSWSKTMARAPYGNLYAGPGAAGNPSGSTLVSSSNRAGATKNNPTLKPLLSDNLDLGIGWYFAPSSYVSLTFWDKRVDNFIGTSTSPRTLYGLRDPTSGPRAQKAAAFLQGTACAGQVAAAGGDPTSACALNNTSLFTTVALLTHAGATGGLAAYDGSSSQTLAMENKYNITAQSDDPLYQYNVSQPVNQHKARLHGWEFGGQYFFGQTGFGILANYTKVQGDVHFDNAGVPGVDQFALTGLSDTANVVLMYEKYGFSVRLAWNWRSEYLMMANQGNSSNPYYVDAYRQYDLGVNYNVNDHLSFMLDAVNLTGEDVRWHARSMKQMVRLVDQKPRYALGVRYKF